MDSRKYIIAFVITAVIFGTAIFISDMLNRNKIANIAAIENRVALDILSSETQFALLQETSCRDVGPGYLSKELGTLNERLTYAETQSGFSESDLEYLRRSYFLLEIKDYLLMKELTEKCGMETAFILYFYSTESECEDCVRMGYVLTALREKYPELRVYSFNYNEDLAALDTLKSIYKIENELPALIINGRAYYGFRSIEDLEAEVPALSTLASERALMLENSTTTEE